MQNPFKINQNYLEKRIVDHPWNLFVILSIITALETFFLIRGAILFDFARQQFIIYETAYAVLLVFSLAGAIYVFFTIKNGKIKANKYYAMSIIYEAIIISFSTTISCLDAMGASGQTIVYITTILAIPVIVLINPFLYSLFTMLSTAALLSISSYAGGVYFTSGAIINYAVLDILAILTCFTLYRLLESYYKKEEMLNTLSLTDQLTGLYNRRKLDNDMKSRDASVSKEPCAFILCDIDDFKAVNDKNGHAFGDGVLSQVAQILKDEFGETTYRYGGDEFAIFTAKSKEEIQESIESINTHLSLFSSSETITLSFGIYFSEKNDEAMTLFRGADKALYATKGNEESSFSFYNPKDNKRTSTTK